MGGGGIPVVQKLDDTMIGVEAVIDKDHASGLLAREIGADAFLMRIDVQGVFTNWENPDQALLRSATSTGGFAAIGRLSDCAGLMNGATGTMVSLQT